MAVAMRQILHEGRHAVTLLPPSPDSAWVHLIPSGRFAGRDGRGPYVLDADAVLAAFRAATMDLAIDYDHQSLTAAGKAGPVPAAGWIHALESRADGIWGQVTWTERATEALAHKEYRYLSPVFRYEAKTGRVVALTGAGLTNTPNLELQAAAAQEQGAVMELMERLSAMLHLPATATAEQIMAEVEKMMAKLSEADTAMQAAQARLDSGPDPTQWVPKAMYDEAAHRLATVETERTETAVQQAVTAAQSARKITPAMKDWALDYARRDLEGFTRFVAAAPEFVSGETTMPAAAAQAAQAQLDAAQREVNRQLGLDTETFTKYAQ